MTRRFSVCGALALLLLLVASPASAQYIATQNASEVTVIEATTVFAQSMMMQDNSIPRNVLAGAQGIVIVPSMVRGAFVFGVQFGRGVLVYKDAAGNWQAPRMVQLAGGSFGYQIGVQATDLVLVFRTPQAVNNVLRGTMKVGVDASAAAGPVGRQASAGTDLGLNAEILSYSRARGLYAGVSIDGSTISLDPSAEAIYYQPPGTFPASAMQLLQYITAYTAVQPVGGPTPAGAVAVAGAVPNGWVAAGSHTGDVEGARQQLASASQQLNANLPDNWKSYLALPRDVSVPNQSPNPQEIQRALQNYEAVARDPQYTALTTRPEFQQALNSLRTMNNTRVASNSMSQLPAPPR